MSKHSTLNKNDIKILYNSQNKPTDVLIKYNRFLELIEVMEDKSIEAELTKRIKSPEFVDESEIFDV